jgi:hypothetical protein
MSNPDSRGNRRTVTISLCRLDGGEGDRLADLERPDRLSGWQKEHSDGRFRRISSRYSDQGLSRPDLETGVRRVRVENVSSVSAAAAALQQPRPAASPGDPANYRHGGFCPTSFGSCCAPTNRTSKPHKKVM